MSDELEVVSRTAPSLFRCYGRYFSSESDFGDTGKRYFQRHLHPLGIPMGIPRMAHLIARFSASRSLPHRRQLIVLESIVEDLHVTDRTFEIRLVIDADLIAIGFDAKWQLA